MAASARMTLEHLNALDRTAFVQALGGIYEHSPWVAEAVWPQRPHASVAALHLMLMGAMGGTISARPNPGGGLQVSFTLPQLSPGAEAAPGVSDG